MLSHLHSSPGLALISMVADRVTVATTTFATTIFVAVAWHKQELLYHLALPARRMHVATAIAAVVTVCTCILLRWKQ